MDTGGKKRFLPVFLVDPGGFEVLYPLLYLLDKGLSSFDPRIEEFSLEHPSSLIISHRFSDS